MAKAKKKERISKAKSYSKARASKSARKAKDKTQRVSTAFCSGSPAHKAQRWKEYKERNGEWDYDRWSTIYELNMVRAAKANAAMDAYREEIGWGEREVTVEVEEGVTRRIDIADVNSVPKRGIEHKTGYVCLTEAIKSEAERDAKLVEQGWSIRWHFEGTASQPLLDFLAENNIAVSFKQ